MICFISCWLQEHFKISLILIMILLSFPTLLLRAAVGCLLPMHDANVCNKYVSTQFTQRLDINNNSREQKKGHLKHGVGVVKGLIFLEL